jgi:hypothetical protein
MTDSDANGRGGRKAPPFYLTPEFKAIDREWKEKLRDEGGFRDIEHTDPATGDASRFFAANPSRAGEYDDEHDSDRSLRGGSTLEYYLSAERYAREAMDGSRSFWHLAALAMHARGKGYRQIARALGRGRDSVARVIQEARPKIVQ